MRNFPDSRPGRYWTCGRVWTRTCANVTCLAQPDLWRNGSLQTTVCFYMPFKAGFILHRLYLNNRQQNSKNQLLVLPQKAIIALTRYLKKKKLCALCTGSCMKLANQFCACQVKKMLSSFMCNMHPNVSEQTLGGLEASVAETARYNCRCSESWRSVSCYLLRLGRQWQNRARHTHASLTLCIDTHIHTFCWLLNCKHSHVNTIAIKVIVHPIIKILS